MADDLKPTPDGFDAMEDSLTRSRSIIESLRAELAKYRGMEVELAAVKNDLEALRMAWGKHGEKDCGMVDVRIWLWTADYETITRILGGE